MHDVRHGGFPFPLLLCNFFQVESEWSQRRDGLDSPNFCHLPLIASLRLAESHSLCMLWDVLFDLNGVLWQ